jgi:hypothetical protein
MSARLVMAIAMLIAAGIPVLAANGIACRCLYQGRYFEQGETVCIHVGGRSRLARCDMELNNSSWKFIQDSCPAALFSPVPPRPPVKAAPVSLL